MKRKKRKQQPKIAQMCKAGNCRQMVHVKVGIPMAITLYCIKHQNYKVPFKGQEPWRKKSFLQHIKDFVFEK